MKIARIEAFPIRLARDKQNTTGTAGSPTQLATSQFDYRWSKTYPALYSTHFETALVRVETDTCLTGWGEAQAPLAPQVACTIVDALLRPAIEGSEFDPTREGVTQLYDRMYSAMRVRGQTGGFMLDAIAGVDIALWDLAGKARDESVARLLGAPAEQTELPAYLSGLSGATAAERVNYAQPYWDAGFRAIKLFHDDSERSLLFLIDALRDHFGPELKLAVDALWRLGPEPTPFLRELNTRSLLWLECPLPPESLADHAQLAASLDTPVAVGESYRARWEIQPFIDCAHIDWIQPDLGRCGITQALRWAELARDANVKIVPHVSIAMGPQIAAALHFAAATTQCPLVEFNPKVFEFANTHLTDPLMLQGHHYHLPAGPGLGIRVPEETIRQLAASELSRGAPLS